MTKVPSSSAKPMALRRAQTIARSSSVASHGSLLGRLERSRTTDRQRAAAVRTRCRSFGCQRQRADQRSLSPAKASVASVGRIGLLRFLIVLPSTAQSLEQVHPGGREPLYGIGIGAAG